jgi:zinc transport system ATP-binding protein
MTAGPKLPAREEPLIRAEDIYLRLADKEILSGISLKVHQGEILTIIGPNGGGKTSLLRVMLGLLRPDSGLVHQAAAIKIGYMPQKIHFDPILPLSVRRFLTLAASRPREALVRALDEVGAPTLLESPVQNVSGGELQRILLARALLREPDLLVLDEPAQGVDVQGQEELFGLISRLSHDRGCAILMVSHDLHLVMAATDRVVCLNRHICCTGNPVAVQADPAFLELFTPRAVGNLALYTHHHNGHLDPSTGKECRHG